MKLWLIVGILIALMSGAGIYYFNTTQKTISILTENNATLKANNKTIEDTNEQNVKTIDELQNEYTRVEREFNELQNEFVEINSQNNLLKRKLEKFDLDVLAANKPKLVERIINNASEKASRCFELLSGSPLNEFELLAETPEEFNSECPWLFTEN